MKARATRRQLLVGSLIAGAFALVGCLHTRGPSLPIDAKAPEFKLKSNDGREVELANLTAHGPAVIVFYRGFW